MIALQCLRSERIVTPAGTVAGEVVIREGRIEEVGPAGGGGADGVIEFGDRWLVPGYIDMHVHGGGGAQCNTSDPDQIEAVARFHAAHGTTALLATVIPAPLGELELALDEIARSTRAGSAPQRRAGAVVLGAHVEGPFLNPRRAGAMDPSVFLEPGEDVARRLLAAGRGTVRMMTLAPELPGALGLIHTLVDSGVIASIGHSDATYEQAQAAVLAGARAATHAFNAMRPFHHREPGVVGAVLDHPALSCELICDGFHVHPAALRLAYRAKGHSGVRLVTDAMQAAGMPDGEYRLGGVTVMVAEGRAALLGSGVLAGSTLTMDAAVRNAARLLELDVPDAVALGSANPARLLGIEHRKGSIAPGMEADIVALDDELMAWATLVGGNWVHGAPAEVRR